MKASAKKRAGYGERVAKSIKCGKTKDGHVTPIRPPALESSFIRGIRSCVAILEGTCDSNEFFVQGHFRCGARQNNTVRQTLDEILRREDNRELEGFCAVLTEICAIADNAGDYERIFTEYADRRERVLRRRYRAVRS